MGQTHPSPFNGATDYWRLNSPSSVREEINCLQKCRELSGNNIHIRRFGKIHNRLQRGLLIYDFCHVEELRKFCTDRGLEPTGTAPELIQRLEAADETDSSHKFATLPAELRVHIFEYYFQDLTSIGFSAEPPITKVSRVVRKESLPIFYDTRPSTYRLGVTFSDEHPRVPDFICPAITRLFKTPTAKLLATIRDISISGVLPTLYINGISSKLDERMTVDFQADGRTEVSVVDIRRGRLRGVWSSAQREDELKGVILSRLDAIQADIKARGDAWQISGADGIALRDVFMPVCVDESDE